MRDPEKEYENAQDVQMEMKARNEEMTNEEAIKLLSQIRDALLASNSWLPSTHNPIKESFGMAINALTAQPQLPDWAQKVEEYRKSAPSFVRNPLVWALYQVWKEYDERLFNHSRAERRTDDADANS